MEAIRRLRSEDAAAYFALRREALEREPFAFGSSPDDDRFQSVQLVGDALVDPAQVLIGAFAPDLIGAVGVRRLPRAKLRHRAEMWGMYVRQAHRRMGYGRQLVEQAIEVARAQEGVRQLHLAVTEKAVAAVALYKSLGFVVWGIEPAGLCVDGVDLAEKHMVLTLRRSP